MLTMSQNRVTRGHSLKIQVPRSHKDVRKRSFSRHYTDISLYFTIQMQRDIDTLQATAASWCFKMNTKKCAVFRFARPRTNFLTREYFLDGEQIPYVDSHSDPGVTVDSQLKFHDHVRTVVWKAGGLANNRAGDWFLICIMLYIIWKLVICRSSSTINNYRIYIETREKGKNS